MSSKPSLSLGFSLALAATLEFTLGISLLEGDLERRLKHLLDMPVRILDANDFGEALGLRLEILGNRETEVVALLGRS